MRTCRHSQLFFDIHEQLSGVDVSDTSHFHLPPLALPQVSPCIQAE